MKLLNLPYLEFMQTNPYPNPTPIMNAMNLDAIDKLCQYGNYLKQDPLLLSDCFLLNKT